jgi:hypothetical protein
MRQRPINSKIFSESMRSLSQKSVANYAIRIKQKLGARSLADLIRLAITTGPAKQNVLSPPAGLATE